MTTASDKTPLVPPALKRLGHDSTILWQDLDALTELTYCEDPQEHASSHAFQLPSSPPRAARSTISGVVTQFNQLRYRKSTIDRISSAIGGIFRRICGHGGRGLPLLEEVEEPHGPEGKENIQKTVPTVVGGLFSDISELSDGFSNVSVESFTGFDFMDRRAQRKATTEGVCGQEQGCPMEVKGSAANEKLRWNTKRQRWTSSPKKYSELDEGSGKYTPDHEDTANGTKPKVIETSLKKSGSFGETGDSLNEAKIGQLCPSHQASKYDDGGRIYSLFKGIRNLYKLRRRKKKSAGKRMHPDFDEAESPRNSSFSLDNEWDPWGGAEMETAIDLEWSLSGLRRRSSSYDVLSVRESSTNQNSFTDTLRHIDCLNANVGPALSSRLCFSAMAAVGRDKPSAPLDDTSVLSHSKSENFLEGSQGLARHAGNQSGGLVHSGHLSESKEDLVGFNEDAMRDNASFTLCACCSEPTPCHLQSAPWQCRHEWDQPVLT
ncbi:uncharacterized protein LOC101857416 [Aplysia californica]|uniref:Uncharacterized protein LOC101857416 n=1 Tax=Aplysia californica TaxID=6500 RepID=A0ABM0JT45_APLCA|nr:uncharacterized protein LOC101857416 [Aplysia californica]